MPRPVSDDVTEMEEGDAPSGPQTDRITGEELDWHELTVPETASGKRVDMFVAANAPDHISRARVQSLLRQGAVLINDQKPKGTSQKLKEADVVRFAVPAPVEAYPEPEDIPLDILFEDDEIIVINKPAGLVVHPSPGNWSGTLVNALLFHCGESLAGIGGVKRPGIVHRLDMDTTGVMVAAKTYPAHQSLSAQFADHGRTGALIRKYQAVVWGHPGRVSGTIDAHLGRHPTSRRKRAVVSEDANDAKHAITCYALKEVFPHSSQGDAIASLVECELETGRTHQIRVHMAHIGHPLIGDPEYGGGFATKANLLPEPLADKVRALSRQALHAGWLTIGHPHSGEIMDFSAPLPPDLTEIINGFQAL
ncbi:MAG: RluA family pseudouridine synthase [Pseudomonadota bacterium]